MENQDKNRKESDSDTNAKTEYSHHNYSKWMLVVFILFILVSLAASTYLFVLHKPSIRKSPQVFDPTPTPTPDPTADWQTYTNEEYDFEFRHPEIFSPENCPERKDFLCTRPVSGPQHEPLTYNIYIVPHDNIPQNLSFPEYINENYEQLDFYLDGREFSYTKKKINNYTAYVTTDIPTHLGGYSTFIEKIDKSGYIELTLIFYSKNDPFEEQEKYLETYNQILSTFRFTDTQTTTPPSSHNPQSSDITWQQAIDFINSCQVDMVFQTHALDVTLTLKDGSKVTAKEPRIDEVFKVVKDAEPTCGTIPLATE